MMSKFNGRIIGATSIRVFPQTAMINYVYVRQMCVCLHFELIGVDYLFMSN